MMKDEMMPGVSVLTRFANDDAQSRDSCSKPT